MGGGSAPQAARREGGDVAFVFCPTAFEHLPRSCKLFNPLPTISSLVAASKSLSLRAKQVICHPYLVSVKNSTSEISCCHD
jgi:hypothetical protein